MQSSLTSTICLDDDFYGTLERYRNMAFKKIDLSIKRKFSSRLLTNLLPEYPSRKGKGIRPALCLGSCAAVGGDIRDALNTASALELFHNAFLVKDDIEDGSEYRRNEETIVSKYGSAVAINIGDALAVLAIKLLINNVEHTGVHKALDIVEQIQHMAKVTVEGQAAELEWVRSNYWRLSNADYYEMCTKKTSWYTAITPCIIGAKIGLPDISDSNMKSLTRFSHNLGLAFQIQYDVLNLFGKESEYGKEINGDLLEGKRTLIMIILYNSSSVHEKRQIRKIFAKKRIKKTGHDIKYIHDLLQKYMVKAKSSNISKDFAKKAMTVIDNECDWMKNEKEKIFLRNIAAYVVERNK